jgi:hypothetical protein
LSGIKIHFREFLYDFALKRNKLLAPVRFTKLFAVFFTVALNMGIVCSGIPNLAEFGGSVKY